MSDQEVLDRLSDYGAWIVQSSGLDLTPGGSALDSPPAEVVEIEITLSQGSAPTRVWPSRVFVLAAAAAVVVGLTLAITNPFGTSADQTSTFASSAVDPTGPLFVLPDPNDGYSLIEGSVSEGDVAEALLPTQFLVLGSLDGAQYRDLVLVRVSRSEPDTHDGWGAVELATGPAVLSEGFGIQLLQERDGMWISVSAASGRNALVTGVMEELRLGADGLVRLADDTALTVLYIGGPFASGFADTSYQIPGTASPTEGISIETFVAVDIAVSASFASFVGEAVVTRLGEGAWQITRQDPEGEWNGVGWQATPNHGIAVSGVASLEEILAVAASLRIVDEQTWQSALPDYIRD